MTEIYLRVLEITAGISCLIVLGSIVSNYLRRESLYRTVRAASLPPLLSILGDVVPSMASNRLVRELQALAAVRMEMDELDAVDERLRTISALPLQSDNIAYQLLVRDILEGKTGSDTDRVLERALEQLGRVSQPLLDAELCGSALRAAGLPVPESDSEHTVSDVFAGYGTHRWVHVLSGPDERGGDRRVRVFIPVLGPASALGHLKLESMDWNHRRVILIVSEAQLPGLLDAAAQLKDAILSSGYSDQSIKALFRGLVEARASLGRD